MESKNFLEKVKEWPSAVKSYYGELKSEMKRVTWPGRKQVESTTMVVILTVFAFAAYFAIVDSVLNQSVVKLHHVLAK